MHRVIPAILFSLFIVWVVIQANLGRDSILFNLVGLIPFGDKVGHLILFGILSIFTIIAFNYRTITYKKLDLPIGALLVFIFAFFEEISQLFFVNRTFDLFDLLADTIGIVLSVYITKLHRIKINLNQVIPIKLNK